MWACGIYTPEDKCGADLTVVPAGQDQLNGSGLTRATGSRDDAPEESLFQHGHGSHDARLSAGGKSMQLHVR